MTITERDKKLVAFLPALLLAVGYWYYGYEPASKEVASLKSRIVAAGSTEDAWTAPIAQAKTAVTKATEAKASAKAKYDEAYANLLRERGTEGGVKRTKPGAIAILNKAAAQSKAVVVSAVSCSGLTDEAAASGSWQVTFLGAYPEMSACLKALSEEPGVLVRSIDRIPAEDGAAKPIWNLKLEL